MWNRTSIAGLYSGYAHVVYEVLLRIIDLIMLITVVIRSVQSGILM